MAQQEKRNLVKAMEDYTIALKLHLTTPSSVLFNDLQKKRRAFCDLAKKTTVPDIEETFTDLQDYWDTLDVGK